MRGQYPSFSPSARRVGARVAGGFFAALLLAAALGACARQSLLILLDPLFVVAEPEAAASLSRFRPSGYSVHVLVLDPAEAAPDSSGAAAVLASPLALALLAEGPATRLPLRLFAIDASEPRGLEGRVDLVRFERSRAWKDAGALAAALLSDGGKAAVVVVEGRGRSRLRASDFSDGLRGAGGGAPLARILSADSSSEAMDAAIDALLAQDLRCVALSAGALTPRALRRLDAAGIVVIADQGAREAAFLVEDDYEAALAGIEGSLGGGTGGILAPSRLVRGPGFEAAAARYPALIALAKGLRSYPSR